jgi:hypothetical protein
MLEFALWQGRLYNSHQITCFALADVSKDMAELLL